MEEPEGDEMEQPEEDEVITLKVIQKLTGKLAQKLRAFQDTQEDEEPMTSKDIKYVVNSILSALNLESLDEEDKEDILNKIEGVESDEEFGGEEIDMEEPEGDEMGMEEPEGEMAEGDSGMFDDEDEALSAGKKLTDKIFGEGHDEEDGEEYHSKIKGVNPKHGKHMEDVIEGLFTESKVDDILKKYFKIEENERNLIEAKKQKLNLIKENKSKTISKIKIVSESISQEVASTKLVSKYPNAKLVGKTNHKNLVFEMNNKQLRVTVKGQII
jgi:hypothetical protein